MSYILKKITLLNERGFKYRNVFTAQKVIPPVILVTLSMIVISFLIMSLVDVVIWSTHWLPWIIVCEKFCAFTAYVITVKYVVLVQYYRYKYREMNCQIEALNDLTGSEIMPVVLKDVRATPIVNGRLNGSVADQRSGTVVWSTVNNPNFVCLNGVKALKGHHIDLYELSQLLNSTFGYQILLCFSLIFFNILSSYNCVIDLMLKLLSRKEGIATDVQESSMVCMALISSLTLILLTSSCHMASEEASKSQLLVHKLLLRSDLSNDVTAQLQQFSSQVSNLKVKFTICGFFAINAKLLCNTVGVICTYLIVLYQFK
jgi:hypothetical protein